MMKIRTGIAAIAIMAAAAVAVAQGPGADVYKTRCQSCHGATGVPSPAMAKAMGVKPIGEVKSSPEAKMITVTTNGAGKMPAFKGKLTDAQIKDSVSYFRSLAK
jgi:mono/diheme cytochrome c family protein